MNWRHLSRELGKTGRVHCGYGYTEERDPALDLVEFHDNGIGFGRGVISEQSSETFERGGAKDGRHRHLSAGHILYLRDQACCQQRVAPDFKKVVVDPNGGDSKHVLPDFDKQLLFRIKRLASPCRFHGDRFPLLFLGYRENRRCRLRETRLTVY